MHFPLSPAAFVVGIFLLGMALSIAWFMGAHIDDDEGMY